MTDTTAGSRRASKAAPGAAPGAEDWRRWIGRTEEAHDRIDAVRAQALQATLNGLGAAATPPLADGDSLPPLWHWIYFWSVAPASALDLDGHEARGAFLPPIDLPRRMWAGSRVRFPRPLPIGSAVIRRSEIVGIEMKEGRSGQMAFVTVAHSIADQAGPYIEEEHDIVYLPVRRAAAPASVPAPAEAPWQLRAVADPVLLFRYSALTFNGHRIHYDQRFVTEDEGYPGLVVHGPLLATLMVELARRNMPSRRIAAFAFRARSPIFEGLPFMVAGTPAADGKAAELWVADDRGAFAMQGSVDFAAESF